MTPCPGGEPQVFQLLLANPAPATPASSSHVQWQGNVQSEVQLKHTGFCNLHGCQFAIAKPLISYHNVVISIVPSLPNYSIVVLAYQRVQHLHFAIDKV